MTPPKEWYTVEEAAEYLGVSRRTIYSRVQEGRMAAHVLGDTRVRRFREEDLDRVPRLARRQAAPALSAADDPVLAGLWDNDLDAAYDSL